MRKVKGTTQKQVAEGSEIAERVYQRYESGERKPPFDKLITLADYFGVSIDYLVGRTDNPRINKNI